MVITQKVIDELRSNVAIKNKMALSLNTSVHSLERWLLKNKDNGPLTSVASIQFIEAETGLNQADILEETNLHPAN
jgi:hypothetical protein